MAKSALSATRACFTIRGLAQGNPVTNAASAPRRPIGFFALTMALAVPFWVLGSMVQPPSDAAVALPLSALQFVCPAIAATLLVARDEGRGGVGQLFRRLLTFRGRPRWYVVIASIPVAVYGVSYSLKVVAWPPVPSPTITVGSVAFLVLLFLIAATVEEAGWTGYALEPLQARWGALPAALLIGVVWAAFHLVADLQGDHDVGWIVWHRSGATALRVLIVWAYNATGGSIPAAILMHAMDNLCWSLAPGGASAYDPTFSAPVMVAAAAAVTLGAARAHQPPGRASLI